jgi:predicted HTH domain antitoxin
MTFTIPDPIAKDAGLDQKSALKEFALALYAQDRLSAGQVRRICDIGYFEFVDWVTERGLPVHTFTQEQLDEDLATLRSLNL